MLRLNIQRLVRMRSKQRPLVYLMMHGFTRDEARSLLNPRLKSLKLELQTRLCNLFICEPNDLYCHVGVKESHLNALNHGEVLLAEDMLEGLSPEDIAELKRIADAKRKKRK